MNKASNDTTTPTEKLHESVCQVRGLLYLLSAAVGSDRDQPDYCQPTAEENEGFIFLALRTGKELADAAEEACPQFESPRQAS